MTPEALKKLTSTVMSHLAQRGVEKRQKSGEMKGHIAKMNQARLKIMADKKRLNG